MHESGWWYGCEMVRLTGVVAVKLPDEPPADNTLRARIVPATKTSWSGLEVTVTVSVTGLVAVPLASQIAKSPWALQEANVVLALAAAVLAAIAPAVSRPVTAAAAARRLSRFMSGSFLSSA